MVCDCNPSTQDTETEDQFEAGTSYILSGKPAWATQFETPPQRKQKQLCSGQWGIYNYK